MATKLDKSLDEILSTHRRSSGTRGRGGGSRRSARVARTTVAPVGGVKKFVKTAKGGSKAIPTGPSARFGESKVVVSNMPKDVNEAQIKEYFGKSVGPIRKVEISYGPNGVSRGIANITFSRSDGANKALKALNGLLVDSKPMKIEILVDASLAPSIPAPKTLGERIAQPKSQPKSAATTKATTNSRGTSATADRAGRKGRGRTARSARPSKKTAEELDTEMADYFVNAGGAVTEGGAATNGGGQSGDVMEDEIL